MSKKSIKTLSFLLAIPFIIMSCTTGTSSVYSSVSTAASDYYPTPSAYPSLAATSAPGIGGLLAGDLPTYISDEEKNILAIYQRSVNVQFPLRVGVLSFSNLGGMTQESRTSLYDAFVTKLKTNENISQVVEVPKSLSSSAYDIESIRKLAARFQVSTVLVISDTYQYTTEDKTALITPIDVITGNRKWESTSNVEAYAIDVLTGVIMFSSISQTKANEKYNKNDPDNKNKDSQLITKSATESWDGLYTKINKEMDSYKKFIQTNPSPTVTASPVATVAPTAVPSVTPTATPTASSSVTIL